MNYRLSRSTVARKRYWLLFVILAVMVALPAGAAQVGEPVDEDGWEFAAVLYLWALSLDGDATVKGKTADVDMSFSDIWDHLNIALMADFEAKKGRWGFAVNPFYSELDGKDHGTILTQPTSIDLTMKMFMMEFGANYRLGPYPLADTGQGTTPTLTVLPMLGGRYTYLDADVKVKAFQSHSANGSKDWADPFLGVRTIWDITPRWNVIVGGNVGGFGVGSDLAWAVNGLLGYRFNLTKSLAGNALVGYRALYQDYKDGSGSDRFEWDVTMYGPVLGMSIRY